MKGVRSFLRHAIFYRRFIKHMSKIAHLKCKIWRKRCNSFLTRNVLVPLNGWRTSWFMPPMINGPDWANPFMLIGDASGSELRSYVWKKQKKMFHPIYYTSNSLTRSQQKLHNYWTGLMAMVYAFEKLRAYLLDTRVILRTYHVAQIYLTGKKYYMPRLIRLALLLQEIEIKIKDRRGC